MHGAHALLSCVLALALATGSAHASGRTLAQVPASPATTPTVPPSTSHLRYNVTLLGVSEISNEEADGIKSALNMTFTRPQPAEIVVSSNTAPEDDRLTLIILVYPASTGDIKHLQIVLEETETRSTFLRNLNREADLHVENVQVNSVTLQGNSQIGGRPVTGTSLAGVLVVIAVGAILVVIAALFGVRSLLQIRDLQAKAKAGYATVELSDPHLNMETGLQHDSSPRHGSRSGSPEHGGRSGSPTRGKLDDSKLH